MAIVLQEINGGCGYSLYQGPCPHGSVLSPLNLQITAQGRCYDLYPRAEPRDTYSLLMCLQHCRSTRTLCLCVQPWGPSAVEIPGLIVVHSFCHSLSLIHI